MKEKIIIIIKTKNDRSYEEILKKEGFEIAVLNEIPTKIEDIKNFESSILLLDIPSPEDSDYNFVQMLRQDSFYKHIFVAVFSDAITQNQKVKFLQSGVDGFISHNSDDEDFVLQIRVFLKQVAIFKALQQNKKEKRKIIEDLRIHQAELEMQNQTIKEAQEKLVQSEHHYYQLFDNSPIGFVILNEMGIVHKINYTLLNKLKIGHNDIIQQPFLKLIHKEDQNIFNLRLKAFYKNPSQKEINLRLVSSDKHIFFCKIIGSHVKQTDLDKPLLQLAITDVSLLKQTEINLLQEKNMAELILSTIPSGVFTVDNNQIVTNWNQKAEQVTGYTAKDVMGKKCSLFAAYPCNEKCAFREKDSSFPFKDKQCHFLTKHGKEIIVSKNIDYLRDHDGKIIGGIEIFRDVTEEHSMKEQLRKTNDIIRNSRSVAFSWKNEEGWPVEFVTENVQSLFGYTAEDFIAGKIVYADHVHPKDIDRVAKEVIKNANNKEIDEFEHKPYRIITKDNNIKWIKDVTQIVRDSNNKAILFQGVLEDITKQIKAETTVNKFFEQTMNIHLIADLNGIILRVNKGWRSILGYDSDELINTKFIDLVHPEDKKDTINEMKKLGEGQTVFFFENRYLHKNGDWVYLNWSSVAVPEENVVYGVASNITERKKAEKRLQESKQKFANIIENTTNLFYTHDTNHIVTYLSPQSVDFLGYKPEEAMRRWTEFATDNPINEIALNYTEKAIQTGETQPPYKLELQKKNGEKILVEVHEAPIVEDGKVVSIVGSLTNITLQELAIQKLEESQNFATKISNTTPALLYIYDYFEEKNIWENQVHKDFFKDIHNKTGLEYQSIVSIVHPDDFAELMKKNEELMNNVSLDKIEVQIRIKKIDHWHWMNLIVSPFKRDNDGKIIQSIGALFDIHEQKQIQEELKQSREALHTALKEQEAIFNSSLIGIMVLENRILTKVNDEMAKMLGYKPEEIVGKGPEQLHLSMDNFEEFGKKYYWRLSNKEILDLEYPLKHKDGHTVWCQFNGKAIDPPDLSKGAVWIIEDITQRKKNQQKIHDLLGEKEMLLREVHHRIKNNMATIESILKIHSRKIADLAAQKALKDASGRVRSMRVLYDKLYRAGDFEEINMKMYLEPFIDEIVQIFPNYKEIHIHKEIDDFKLRTKVVFPLGIMLNELITNTMKYAFTEKQKKEIFVSVKRIDDVVRIVLQDNGVGLPVNFNWKESKGFGFHLIRMLIEQLRGSLQIEQVDGTRFIIDFIKK